MLKNYCLAATNLLIASLPILLTWDPIICLYYLGIWVFLLSLLCWNIIGDTVVVLFVIRAHPLPQDAVITPKLNRYIEAMAKKGLLRPKNISLYYTDSDIPYCIPLSKKRIIISFALAKLLERKDESLLYTGVPRQAYDAKVIISRKVLLLSLVNYTVVIRIMELWAIVFALVVKLIIILAVMIATGAFFGNSRDVGNAFSAGSFIGDIVLKINKVVNFLQDKIIKFVMDWTLKNSFQLFEESESIRK